jgi:hypothetical protein
MLRITEFSRAGGSNEKPDAMRSVSSARLRIRDGAK